MNGQNSQNSRKFLSSFSCIIYALICAVQYLFLFYRYAKCYDVCWGAVERYMQLA